MMLKEKELETKINDLQSLRSDKKDITSRKELDDSIAKFQSKYKTITGNYFNSKY